MRRRLMIICWVMLTVLLYGLPAEACSLDGVPSLSANGHLAGLTKDPPTQATLAHWARFTLPAAAPGDALRLTEDLSNLRRSLPVAALARPFRWSFGDGTSAQGYAVVHRYARQGWYRIMVSALLPGLHNPIVFDSARLQIVAANDLWRANLRYYLAQDAQAVLRFALWSGGLLLVGWFLWKRRPRHAAPRQ
jgi:hypothetical protein